MIIGFAIDMALIFAAVSWSSAEIARFYDAYAARYRGVVPRQDLIDEQRRDPLSFVRQGLRGGGLGIARIYTGVTDANIERLRRRAALAANLAFATWVLFLPTLQLTRWMFDGVPLGRDWPWLTLLRSALLLLAAVWTVRWRIAKANPEGPMWWRVGCVLGMVSAIVGYGVALAL